ncbi:MAG: hypothetical protein HYY04_16405 [Chloroflexi bacterium]|nr:hypothetical protein [Chloroflexota bacterium]
MFRPRLIVLAAAIFVALLLAAPGAFGAFRANQPPPPDGRPVERAARGIQHPLPPELEFLRTLPAEQQFDRFTGAHATFLNPQGDEVIVHVTPGVVRSVAAQQVTIDPNGPVTTRTFNITQNTFVRGEPRRGRLTIIGEGDRVVVVSVGDSSDAFAVAEVGQHFRRGMMRGPMMPHMPMQGEEHRGGQPPATATPAATS